MGRQSSIKRLRPEVRQRIERHLREDRLTLAEILADLRAQFPQESLPAPSSLWRQKKKFDAMLLKTREQQEMATVLAAELGENPDEKAATLLVQSITALVTQAALAAQADEEEGVDIELTLKLARAAKDIIAARKERLALREEARRELLQEQRQRFDELGQSGQIDAATLDKVIKAAYGL